ncbi:MAG: ABC transporter permease, partial [Planctomycetota bacterium]
MISLIVRRLLQLPIILLVIYTLTLTLAWAIPGNPLDNDEGRRPPAAVVERMQAQYNLDSFGKFYFSYLSSATGWKYLSDRLDGTIAAERARAAELGIAPRPRRVFDLGPSLNYEDWSVNEILAFALPVSATLGIFAILIATVVGVAAGVIGAIKPNSIVDLCTLVIALIGISLPSFVTGTILLLLFCVWIPLFPVAGWGTLDRLIQPSIALSLPFAAYIARLTRMGMIETLHADYIRTARAKGVREQQVILKHALKNAFLPVLSFLGPATALAMTGSFIVERVFTIPGMGEHFVNAVQTKDLFLIIGVVLVFATLLILFNLAVDLLYHWVDPRIEQ